MRNRIVLITASVFICITLFANRGNQKDSFLTGYSHVKLQDSVDYLLHLARELTKSNTKKAALYAMKAWEICSEHNWEEKRARACIVVGSVKLEQEDFYAAKKYLMDAKNYYDKQKNDKITADILFRLGLTNYYLSKYDEANSDYFKAIKIFNKLGDKHSVAKALQNIGLIYHNLDELGKAASYYRQALDMNKQFGNDTNIAALYQNLGIIYYRNKDYDNALDYYERSFNLYNSLSDTQNIAVTFSNIGLIHLDQSNYDEAYENFRQAYRYFKQVGYKMGQMWASHNMGIAKVSLGEYESARNYFTQSLNMSRQLNYLEGVMANDQKLSELHEKLGDYKSALDYYHAYTAINDSIHSTKLKERIAQLEALYKVESQEKQLTQTAEQLKQLRIQKLAILVVLVIVVLMAVFIYVAYRQKKSVELKLASNKLDLENAVIEKTRELENQITERRIAEESDKLKSAFLANMSHELRTPMNAIIAFSHFLRDNGLSADKRNEYLDHITSAGDSLLHLIDDIIDIAKIEAKQLKIFIGPVNISRLLRELYRVFQELKAKNSSAVELEIIMDPNFDFIINTDSLRVKQILTNLLENAFKYTEKGTIQFGFLQLEEGLQFFVKDTGMGIPKEKQSKIFERFSQLEYALDRKFGGTGLGLTISKNLAELLGGRLWVDSEEGRGSTFYFLVPSNNLRTVPITIENSGVYNVIRPKPYNWESKIILVAEDEELNYKVLHSVLSRTNAKVLRAIDGEMAVKLCKNEKVDLVLMDIQMPVMDGYKATREIKKINRNIPVIAQTSFAMANEKERCIKAGCDDYITKPLDIDNLLSKIDDLIMVNAKSTG